RRRIYSTLPAGRCKAGLVPLNPPRGCQQSRIPYAKLIYHGAGRSLKAPERSMQLSTAPVQVEAMPKFIVKFISTAHAISSKCFRDQNSSLRAAPAFTRSVTARGSRKRARQSQYARRAAYCLKRKGWCSPAAASSRGSLESMDRDGLLC